MWSRSRVTCSHSWSDCACFPSSALLPHIVSMLPHIVSKGIGYRATAKIGCWRLAPVGPWSLCLRWYTVDDRLMEGSCPQWLQLSFLWKVHLPSLTFLGPSSMYERDFNGWFGLWGVDLECRNSALIENTNLRRRFSCAIDRAVNLTPQTKGGGSCNRD